MSTADFAAFSNNAIMYASIVYVFAFLAHLLEWSAARSSATSLVAAENSAARPAAAPASLVPREARQTRPASVDRAAPSSVASTKGTVNHDSPGDDERAERWGRIGVLLTVLAVALHFVALVTRGLGSDPVRVPWGNMYEFTLAGAFGVSVMYLVLGRRYQLRWMGLPVTAFEVVVLMLAVLLLYVPAGPLVPALHSYWLVIHVMAAIIASGAFAVGAIASALYLVKERALGSGALRSGGYLERLPDLVSLDRIAYRLHAFGFPIWTFAALVAGPIWAEYAWGSYWNWDPKEVWAFITWVVYAAYLHARATAGWRGRAAAMIALVAFATLLFNFVGINFFFGGGSMHSYAG
ncbi:c-type cytochrome biogenesis protein CcsB [soil metagenome]